MSLRARETIRRPKKAEPFSPYLLLSGKTDEIHQAIRTHQETVAKDIDETAPRILQPDKTAMMRIADETGCSLKQLAVEYCVQGDFLDAVQRFYNLRENNYFPPDSPDACILWTRDGGGAMVSPPIDEVGRHIW